MLEVQTPPGKLSLISPQVMNRLEERLREPQGFKSYSQIQQWLNQEFRIVVAYKTVHKIVRYKLNAKLKVPRPSSIKAKPEAQEAFKKTCHR
ncbi:winged helix-turn-helix domain-containing protein [Gloeothece citriformis]|uniref:winged helix-turn-helix domain-containing protein n=1 Tax=Gloeothece citriformis TaxID=2546356 RepID=UPI000173BAEC|nr:winged helix-turn-helix domain-containing protein [Gloeothece citriformis]